MQIPAKITEPRRLTSKCLAVKGSSGAVSTGNIKPTFICPFPHTPCTSAPLNLISTPRSEIRRVIRTPGCPRAIQTWYRQPPSEPARLRTKLPGHWRGRGQFAGQAHPPGNDIALGDHISCFDLDQALGRIRPRPSVRATSISRCSLRIWPRPPHPAD
jgi:hypothetical protein